MADDKISSRLYEDSSMVGKTPICVGVVNVPNFSINHSWTDNSGGPLSNLINMAKTAINTTMGAVGSTVAETNAMFGNSQNSESLQYMLATQNRAQISYSGFEKKFAGTDINMSVSLEVDLIKSTNKPEDNVRTRVMNIVDKMTGRFSTDATASYLTNTRENATAAIAEEVAGNNISPGTGGVLFPPNEYVHVGSIDLSRIAKGTYVLVTPYGIYKNIVPTEIDVSWSPTVGCNDDGTASNDPIWAHLSISFKFARMLLKEDLKTFFNMSTK